MTATASFVLARTAAAALVCAGAIWCRAPAGAQGLDALYASAKTEKSVTVWAAGPTAPHERAARAFEQQYPGITVSLTGGFSNVLNSKIEGQFTATNIETDVAILQTIQDFMNWNRRGLLVHFKPEGFDKIDSRYKDKEGAWVAINRNPIFYGFNNQLVQHSDVPTLAIDFLRPKFKGKVITAYPADDDATLFAFATIVQKYGWGFMNSYMKQQPKFVQGHLGVARSLASGESVVSFDMVVSSTLTVQREGGKIALAGPSDDYLPIFFTAEAILKDSPHPNAAKLYVSWYLSKAWQSQTGVYSSRTDLPPPAGLPPLSVFRLEERYAEFLSNEVQLADLRRRFEGYSGPVTNTGGVR